MLLSERTPPPAQTKLLSLTDDEGSTLLIAECRSDPFVIQVAYPKKIVNDVLAHMLSAMEILVPIVLFFRLPVDGFLRALRFGR